MTNDLRERVARGIHAVSGTDAIEDNWALRSPLNVYDGESAHQWRLDQADAAIAAMGLPTRDAVEAAMSEYAMAVFTDAQDGDYGDNTPTFKAMVAARQRLLDLIPMKEDGDE